MLDRDNELPAKGYIEFTNTCSACGWRYPQNFKHYCKEIKAELDKMSANPLTLAQVREQIRKGSPLIVRYSNPLTIPKSL